MDDNEKLIEEAKHAATYPDVRPISYRLVKRLADALEAAEKPQGEPSAAQVEAEANGIELEGYVADSHYAIWGGSPQ